MEGQEETLVNLLQMKDTVIQALTESKTAFEKFSSSAKAHQEEVTAWQNEIDMLSNKLMMVSKAMHAAQVLTNI